MRNRPALGAKVRIKAKTQKKRKGAATLDNARALLEGRFQDVENNAQPHQFFTCWPRLECVPVEGIFIGWRTVYEGYTDGQWVNPEDGIWEVFFSQKRKQEVWLVVTNPRHNPVRVYPDDVEVIEDAG